MRNCPLVSLILCLVTLPIPSFVSAQQINDLAIPLHVMFEGAYIQRTNTSDELPLQYDALSPLGQGDRIRTNNTGRILIEFPNLGQLYILPNTSLKVIKLQLTQTNSVIFEATVDGRIIQITPSNTTFEFYKLHVGDFALTNPAHHFLIDTSTSMDAVIVSAGTATLHSQNQDITISENRGFMIDNDQAMTHEMIAPMNATQLLARNANCQGIVENQKDHEVNVRVGADNESDILSVLSDKTEVNITGISQSKNRLQIQFFSHLGWVFAPSIQFTCDKLQSFSDNHRQNIHTIQAVSQTELAILAPYYGMPNEDYWFYR